MVNCICDQISFITSKCETQSGRKIAQSKCRILHPLHKLRKKRARKTSVAQTDLSKVTFHTITSSVSLVTRCQLCLAFQHLIQIGLITNSQSKTPTYVLATLRDSNMILCTNSQTLYTEGLERLRLRQRSKVSPLFS